MAIQSSINSLLSQAQRLATYYSGFNVADKIVKDQKATKNEAKIQTDIAAGNAPMKDGKVDPEWLKKRREAYEGRRISDFYNKMFDSDGKLSDVGKGEAQYFFNKMRKGVKFDKEVYDFYNDSRVQDYLKSFNEKNARFESALDTLESSISPELQNELARTVAKYSVKSRTNNINKTKADFKKHMIGVKKDKGSELN